MDPNNENKPLPQDKSSSNIFQGDLNEEADQAGLN